MLELAHAPPRGLVGAVVVAVLLAAQIVVRNHGHPPERIADRFGLNHRDGVDDPPEGRGCAGAEDRIHRGVFRVGVTLFVGIAPSLSARLPPRDLRSATLNAPPSRAGRLPVSAGGSQDFGEQAACEEASGCIAACRPRTGQRLQQAAL